MSDALARPADARPRYAVPWALAHLPVSLEASGVRHGPDGCWAPWEVDLATGASTATCPHAVWVLRRPTERRHDA